MFSRIITLGVHDDLALLPACQARNRMKPPAEAAIAILVLVVLFDAACLADLARARAVRSIPKWAWALVICVSSPWGGLLYLIFGRERGRPPGSINPPVPAAGIQALGGALASRATIEVRELSKHFGAVTALDGLSFAVRPGQVTGFLGPNGAGKTTTMRIVLGLISPTAGTALVGGRPYREIVRPLREVGALLDASDVHGARTGLLHLLAIARSNGIGRRRVDEVLRATGLDAVANRPVGHYSLGMKQRLGIAAALLGDPGVLLFDEPVNGLDAEGVLWVRGLLRSLASEGRTVLVSSHLMSEMAVTANHLIIIGRGRLLADTPTEAFVAANARKDVLVRSPQASDLAALLTGQGAIVRQDDGGALAVTGMDAPAIGDLAAGQRIAVHELTPRHASLEEAYLDLTGASADFHSGGVNKHNGDNLAAATARAAS
jgi:ABC-2 type transport system ATP-binding protein